MNKIVVHRPGGFSRLCLETHAEPPIEAGEVRVSTRAVGVNFADCIVRMGLYKSAREFVGWPTTPGFEFSGVVAELGAGVSDLAVGDAVFGVTRFGGYASEVVARREFLMKMPAEFGFAQAATFPVVFLTAWYALFVLGRLEAGQRVLVHSAAGGVGSALCQLARASGAEVLGVVGSAHKVEVAREQGATRVIDKRRERLWPAACDFAPRGFDVVLDANGPETLRQSFEHLAPTGRLVIYGFHTLLSHGGFPNPLRLLFQYLRTPRFNPLEMVDRNAAVLAFNLSYLFEQTSLFQLAMTDLLKRFGSGTIRPLLVSEHPLAEAGRAQRALQSGKTTGKLALIP
jgi:NADPH:quinone reductase-like Zn-dependent oxidoreductase